MNIQFTLTPQQHIRLHQVALCLLPEHCRQEPDTVHRVKVQVVSAVFERGLLSVEEDTKTLREPPPL
jgi:hypothetical protein